MFPDGSSRVQTSAGNRRVPGAAYQLAFGHAAGQFSQKDHEMTAILGVTQPWRRVVPGNGAADFHREVGKL